MKPQKELPRIKAFYQPQAWINDYATNIDGAHRFDCTEAILAMSAEQIKALKDDQYSSDDLATDKVKNGHSGPFYVTVQSEIDEFFYQHKLKITDQSLKKLRKLYKVPPPKREKKA